MGIREPDRKDWFTGSEHEMCLDFLYSHYKKINEYR